MGFTTQFTATVAGTNGNGLNRTFANEFGLLLLGPDVVVVFCNHFHHALQKERKKRTTIRASSYEYKIILHRRI